MKWSLLATLAVFAPLAAYGDSIAVVGAENCGVSNTVDVERLREALERVAPAVQSTEATQHALGGVARWPLAEIERLMAKGTEELSHSQFMDGASDFEAAVRNLIVLAPGEAVRCRLLQDATIAWASALVRLNKPKESQEVLAKILRSQDVKPSHHLYPANYLRLIQRERTTQVENATSTLRVSTRPAGLTVYVDGCPVGTGPVAVQVPAGAYRVEAGFPDGHGLPRTVQVDGPLTAVEFDAEFEGSIYPDQGPCVAFGTDRERRLKAIARLSTVLGVRSIVTLRHDEPTPGEHYVIATLIDGSQHADTREARIKVSARSLQAGDAAKLAEWLVTGNARPPVEPLRQRSPVALQDDALPALMRDDSPRRWERVAGWSLLGVAAGLGAVAVIEQIRKGRPEGELSRLQSGGASVSAQNAVRAQQLIDESNSAAKLRTGFAIGAGVAAACSGTMFVLSVLPAKGATVSLSGNF